MSSAAARRRYANDGTGVVSNQQLLVMLFDRMDRDLREAATQCALGDPAGTNAAIQHAQEIIFELLGALDTGVWDGAKDLQQIYVFVLNEMIEANLKQDAPRIEACREVLHPLGATWREALQNQPTTAESQAV